MFTIGTVHRCFAALAVAAATEYTQQHGGGVVDGESAPLSASSSSLSGPQLWFDDTAAAAAAEKAHVESAAYKELHRPALTTSAMGLFGGEPGFEKAHRVWVDPDRPHMKHLFNQTALAKNLRYTRYGYFKRDMHLLDIDKLVRHARMLPTPNRLLTDFLYQRVPMPDRSCAAILRYQRSQIELLQPWRRAPSFACAEEIFERLVVTNIPPVDVGVETHAEMIHCCAVSQQWEKGWSVFLQRAREMEADSAGKATAFELSTYLFDAVLELCVACRRPVEGLAIMEEVIQRHLRPRASMLDKSMVLVSIAVEQAEKVVSRETLTDLAEAPPSATHDPSADDAEVYRTRGLDLWSLYDFYELPRSTVTVAAYMRMCSMLHMPTLVLEAISFADGANVRLSLECFYWAIYALRHIPDLGDYITNLLGQLPQRGLSADYLLFSMAFLYCAMQQDGELALTIYQQFLLPSDVNPTPEMVLLFLQACAASVEPRIEMYLSGEALLERLVSVGSVVDNIAELQDKSIELAAHVGAVSAAFSKVKELLRFGKPVTTRVLNSLLLANAQSVDGSLSLTLDVIRMFSLMKIDLNDDTLTCVEMCCAAHGTNDEVDAFRTRIRDAQAVQPSHSLGEDADIPVDDTPPHLLRQLKVEWNLRPRDMVLSRFGQHSKPRGKMQVGSMLGSMVPFGRSPGEKSV